MICPKTSLHMEGASISESVMLSKVRKYVMSPFQLGKQIIISKSLNLSGFLSMLYMNAIISIFPLKPVVKLKIINGWGKNSWKKLCMWSWLSPEAHEAKTKIKQKDKMG